MDAENQISALESAVSRLPYPVFVLDGAARFRAINDHAKRLWASERLGEAPPSSHPFAQIVSRLENAAGPADLPTLQLKNGIRYEVIHSTRSPKGAGRWLLFMLRPLPSPFTVDRAALRKRWSLTPKEAEVAAECIAGRSTEEMCRSLAIARETLKTHVARVLDKAGCENRAQLIAKFVFGDD
jgi:DNA-binding CsgD family transcriptional regulator